jgi:hypothetical protein
MQSMREASVWLSPHREKIIIQPYIARSTMIYPAVGADDPSR